MGGLSCGQLGCNAAGVSLAGGRGAVVTTRKTPRISLPLRGQEAGVFVLQFPFLTG